MTRVNQDYLYTDEWSTIENIKLEPHSLYIYTHDPEDRSIFCAQKLKSNNSSTTFIELSINECDDTISIIGNGNSIISLHSIKQIESLLNHNYSSFYLEVTGLSCRVAAPLIKYAMDRDLEMRIVYAEPQKYLVREFQKMGIHKDLCETVNGINPLPGLAHLMPHKEPPLFIVLLGFEGGRFSYIVQDQGPEVNKITPVLGVPGYRINYPYISIWGNQYQLMNTGCWQNMKYAEANSIVDIYLLLDRISFDYRNPEMIVAPIGTKPHAIGAILYSIKHPDKVEIVYDNPKRSVHRTDGIGKILMCNISKLYKEH